MILFFYGPNTFELRRELDKLRRAFIKRTGSDFGLERLDGSSLDSSQLAAAIQAVPLLSSSRLVEVEGLSSNKSVLPAIPKILSAVPDTTVLVLAEPELDKRSSYYKQAIEAASQAVEFKALSGQALEVWLGKEAAKAGASLDRAAGRRLIELAGDDQWRLFAEMGKLANYRSQIGVAEVNLLVEPGVSESIFNLVDAMTAGKAASALKLYQGLIRQRTAEIYILTMIQWQLRNLLMAKTSGLSAPELAKRAGLSPYVAGKAAAKQGSFSQETLGQAVVLSAEYEYRIKSGKLPAEEAVEQLIWEVAERSG